jgi:hypothetical protein
VLNDKKPDLDGKEKSSTNHMQLARLKHNTEVGLFTQPSGVKK